MPQQRRRLLMADTDTSYFNVVPDSQFNPPDWGNTQGNLMGVQMTNDKTKVLLMQNGNSGSSPELQKRIRIYSNSNPNGIIESALDLEYIAQTAEFNFEISGVRQQLGSGFLYNEDLGKIWVIVTGTSGIVAEWDFDIDTNTQSFVQYVTLPYSLSGGSLYFSADGTELYTSNTSAGVSIVKYDLSTEFDISTYSVSETRTWSSADGLAFNSPPFFYSAGGYGIYLSNYGGSGQANINKRQFSTPFDFTSIELGSGYRQGIRRTGIDYTGMRLIAQLPIFFSQDLRKMNYFNNGTQAGGRIGIGYFDIPANFRGLGNELGGVRLLPSTVMLF